MKTVVFYVEQLECTSCESNIEGALKNKPGIENLKTDLFNRTLEIEYDENITNEKQLEKLLKKVGFDVELQD